MILLVDNTVLSNFALVERLDLLQLALGESAATTPQVMAEFRAGVELGRLPTLEIEWLSTLHVEAEEEAVYRRLLRHLNAGEAACLAVASRRSARVLTDDRDARKLARQAGVGVSGTLGVLAQLTRGNQLTLDEADDLLTRMIQGGYRSPIDSIKALL